MAKTIGDLSLLDVRLEIKEWQETLESLRREKRLLDQRIVQVKENIGICELLAEKLRNREALNAEPVPIDPEAETETPLGEAGRVVV